MTTNFISLGKSLHALVDDLNSTIENKNRLAEKSARLRRELDIARCEIRLKERISYTLESVIDPKFWFESAWKLNENVFPAQRKVGISEAN